MKTVFETLREKIGGSVEKVVAEREKEFHILARKESIPKIAAFLIQTLEMRFIFLFASDGSRETQCFHLYYVFSFLHQDRFLIIETPIERGDLSFSSITSFLPQANWQEREVQDLFGLVAKGHPDPRPLVLHEDWPKGLFPLRKDFQFAEKIPRQKGDYLFDRVQGEGVFEIPVGPVHAGIIEPGHFRFSSVGESILKLEIRHFYTHKGTEKLGEGKAPEH